MSARLFQGLHALLAAGWPTHSLFLNTQQTTPLSNSAWNNNWSTSQAKAQHELRGNASLEDSFKQIHVDGQQVLKKLEGIASGLNKLAHEEAYVQDQRLKDALGNAFRGLGDAHSALAPFPQRVGAILQQQKSISQKAIQEANQAAERAQLAQQLHNQPATLQTVMRNVSSPASREYRLVQSEQAGLLKRGPAFLGAALSNKRTKEQAFGEKLKIAFRNYKKARIKRFVIAEMYQKASAAAKENKEVAVKARAKDMAAIRASAEAKAIRQGKRTNRDLLLEYVDRQEEAQANNDLMELGEEEPSGEWLGSQNSWSQDDDNGVMEI